MSLEDFLCGKGEAYQHSKQIIHFAKNLLGFLVIDEHLTRSQA